MKHIAKSILFFAAVFAAVTASAQIQISYGPRLGINLAKWHAEDLDDAGEIKNRLGYLGGAVFEIRFNENFAIQPEINFLQKGVKYSETDTLFGNYSSSADVSFNFLEVPVTLKVGRSFGIARVDLLAGPSLGYGLSGKTRNTYIINGKTEKEEFTINFKDSEISRIDVSLQIGAAVSFGLGESARLFVDGRYLLGFTNVMSSSDSEDPTIHNRGIAFSAGVLFPL